MALPPYFSNPNIIYLILIHAVVKNYQLWKNAKFSLFYCY